MTEKKEKKPKRGRIAILTPVTDMTPSMFTMTYMNFILANMKEWTFDLIMINQKPLDAARNKLLELAKAKNPDYYLWIDSDSVIPTDSLQRLLSADKPIVSGLYFTRSAPFPPVIRRFNKEADTFEFILDYPKDALVECDAAGLGFCLIKAEVINKLKTDKPFFWDKLSEDLNFFKACGEAGYKCWVDTGLIVPHWGGSIDEGCYEGHKASLIENSEIKEHSVQMYKKKEEGGI